MEGSESHASGMTAMASVPGAHYGHFDCDGNPVSHSTGSWKGHVWPGVIFIVWALHWWVSAVVLSKKNRGHVSRTWYPLFIKYLSYTEPILKVVGPFVGLALELRLDHNEWQNLFCTSGKWSGEFSTQHIHNWQHASAYPAFVVTGLVDLVGMLVSLPEGTEKAFLALAFGLEGFVITLHKKSEAFDAMVHGLLAATMWAAALFVGLEIRYPKSLLVSGGRSLAVLLQGMWLVQVGQMMFTGSRLFARTYSGPEMMAPVIFAMLSLTGAVTLLLVYTAVEVAAPGLGLRRYSKLPQTVCDLEMLTLGSLDGDLDPDDSAYNDSLASPSRSGAGSPKDGGSPKKHTATAAAAVGGHTLRVLSSLPVFQKSADPRRNHFRDHEP